MADTHIHIHLNGEQVQAATEPSPSKAKKVRSRSPKPTLPAAKPKRTVSAYHKTVGAEMKKLKKAGFRGNIMKKAHANAKKKHSKKRGKK